MFLGKKQGRAVGLLGQAVFAASAAVLVTACGGDGSGKQRAAATIEVPANPPLKIADTSIAGTVVDAKTGELIENATLRFSGPNISDVRLYDGGDGAALPTQLTAADGTVSLVVRSGRAVSAAAPLEFQVVAEKLGYVSSSTKVVLVKTGLSSFSIPLVALTTDANGELSNVPAGVAGKVVTGQAVDGSGTVRTPVVVASPVLKDANGQTIPGSTALISIPADTQVGRMVNGQFTPAVGSISVATTYFSPDQGESLAAFPGGLSNVRVDQVVSNDNNVDTVGTFTSAGFAAFDLFDSQNNRVDRFQRPVDLEIRVPAGTVNPETGQPVKAGDLVPAWSYDETTGQWSLANDGKRVPLELLDAGDPSKGFVARLKTDHLSYWNLDWYGARCEAAPRVRVSKRTPDSPLVYLELTAANGSGFYAGTGFQDPDTDDTFALNNAPRFGLKVVARDMFGEALGQATMPNPCATSAQPLQLNLDYSALPNNSLRFQVHEQCASGASRRPAAGLTVYLQIGYGQWGRTDAHGVAEFAGLPAAGATMWYFDPHARRWATKPLQLSQGRNDVSATITMPCKTVPVTGATGATGATGGAN